VSNVNIYRRKPEEREVPSVTVVKYAPPLDRNAWEDLRDVAELADCNAEVAEVTFQSGKPVLIAWWPQSWNGEPPEPEYVIVEPGEYLAFSPDARGGWLHNLSEAALVQYYDREGPA
jgi:hypothetical protein